MSGITRVVVRSEVSDKLIKPWAAKHPQESHYDMVLNGNVDLVNGKGKVILRHRRGLLSDEAINTSFPVFKWLKKFPSDNRSKYAGTPHGRMKKKDGTISKSLRALDEDGNRFDVHSTVAGYFGRQGGRHPFCRTTAITRNHPEQWGKLETFFAEMNLHYMRTEPERYKAQMDFVNRTHPAWIIDGTPFTTITVNNTVPAAYHKDAGDLKEGMGCMVVMREGQFQGFELVVPKYKVAVDMQHGDILFFDPTVWHGNIPPYNAVGEKFEDYNRTSIVMYYRKGIIGCLSPEDEQNRAKNRGAL